MAKTLKAFSSHQHGTSSLSLSPLRLYHTVAPFSHTHLLLVAHRLLLEANRRELRRERLDVAAELRDRRPLLRFEGRLEVGQLLADAWRNEEGGGKGKCVCVCV